MTAAAWSTAWPREDLRESLVVPVWPAPASVRAAVTTRLLPGTSRPPFDHCNLGSRCGDNAESVRANRSALVDWLDLPRAPQWLRQVHGIDVHDLDDSAQPDRPEPVADAAYAAGPGKVCAVQTADCLPVLICSRDGAEIAAVHAGWRGLAAGVIEATIARFVTPAPDLHVWLGPAIGAASYEVGEELREAFLRRDPDCASAFLASRSNHWFCDLVSLARRRLSLAGVQSVHGGGFDTRTDARFYSHRASHPTGRFASLIWTASASR